MLNQEFVITVYTENSLGLLSRIAIMFSRRRINIESLNVAASEIKDVHRFTIVVIAAEDVIKKLVLQIDKQVEVLKSFYHKQDEIVWKEQAFFKIAAKAAKLFEIESALQDYGGRLIAGERDAYYVFETNGQPETTDEVLKILEPLGLIEFVRSARIAIHKSAMPVHQRLKRFELMHTQFQ